jgi:hypothetical protein
MNALKVVRAIENLGGALVLSCGRIKYSIPRSAAWLLPEVKQKREAIIGLLEHRMPLPSMPRGVRLVRWSPQEPPIMLQESSVVIDVDKFIAATLVQVSACLEGKDYLAGNWPLRVLIERLEQVGVVIELAPQVTDRVKERPNPSINRREKS